jgi:hypothetical protein
VIKEQFLAKPDKVLQRVTARDNKTLVSYAVVDAKKGLYRMPVGRAMQLLLSNRKLLAPAPKPIQAKAAPAKAAAKPEAAAKAPAPAVAKPAAAAVKPAAAAVKPAAAAVKPAAAAVKKPAAAVKPAVKKAEPKK